MCQMVIDDMAMLWRHLHEVDRGLDLPLFGGKSVESMHHVKPFVFAQSRRHLPTRCMNSHHTMGWQSRVLD